MSKLESPESPSVSARTSAAIDTRALQYFLTLSEHGSLSAAAQALGLSQPTISESLSKLEARLATKLLERSPRGITLTAAGELLAKEGALAFRQLGTLAEKVQSLGSRPRGFISIALHSSLGLQLTVPLIEAIQTTYPEAQAHITEAMSHITLEKIENDELHLGCVIGSPDASKFLAQPFFTEEMFLVVSPAHWPHPIGPDGIALNAISANELAALPLVLPRNSFGARTLIERAMSQRGLELNVVMEIDALTHLIEIASRGSAYTLLPQMAVLEPMARGRLALVPIRNISLQRTAYLTRKRDRSPTLIMSEVQLLMARIFEDMVRRHDLRIKSYPIDPIL